MGQNKPCVYCQGRGWITVETWKLRSKEDVENGELPSYVTTREPCPYCKEDDDGKDSRRTGTR